MDAKRIADKYIGPRGGKPKKGKVPGKTVTFPISDFGRLEMSFAGRWFRGDEAPPGSYLVLMVEDGHGVEDAKTRWMPASRSDIATALANCWVYPVANVPTD